MKINIIGDIAGRFDEFIALIDKMPEADRIIAVGDLVDRGPDSNKVIEWFMNNPKAVALYGNHEDIMYQACTGHGTYLWMQNGGYFTVKSYNKTAEQLTIDMVDKAHIEWLTTLPMYYETDDLFISHAPVTNLLHVPVDPYSRNYQFIWNRYTPHKKQHKFLVNGHNGQFEKYVDPNAPNGGVFGMCIDNSHNYQLMGMHWPTKEIFSVDEPRPEIEDED